MAPLTKTDLAMFGHLRIPEDLLTAAKIQRVSDDEARALLGVDGNREKSLAGLFFPYMNPKTGYRQSGRVRRDSPEIEDGKPKAKYLAGFGDRRCLYYPPGCAELLADVAIPAIVVEAEKSVLAICALSQRTGTKFLPIGTGGCWSWRGRIGRTESPNGERIDEVGPLPDLAYCAHRQTYILLDSNVETNPKVKTARRELAKALRKLKADVHILNLPADGGINGPDDYIGLRGDDAFLTLLASANSAAAVYDIIRTKDGDLKPCLQNAIALLEGCSEWQGVLGFNEFSLHVVTRKSAPWPDSIAGTNWSDVDDTCTAAWLQTHGLLVNSAIAGEAATRVARLHPFHPVRDYLEALQWDSVPRIDTWLIDYLGVADDTFSRAAGSKWLISAVARVKRPGCQVDHTLLLEGPQGSRKSSALRELAGDQWFTDHISDLGSKDSRMELLGRWIIEHSELDRIRRGDLERIKAFLTARKDAFRPPYGRRVSDIPRQCVFSATVNDATPLTDESGNRRFWPVLCGTIRLEELAHDRDQLWAEAFHRFKVGEPWWIDSGDTELLRAANAAQEQRYAPGQWDEVIAPWLENPVQRMAPLGEHGTLLPLEPFHSTKERVTVSDVLQHAVGKPIDRCTQTDLNTAARCLVHIGWTRKQMGTGEFRGKWFYWRPASPVQPVVQPVVKPDTTP